MLEDVVRRLLGYPLFLPVPFRAILLLIPSTALGYLAIWFARHWNDRRLARHCHYIGVPVSIAACVWSGFEPLAGAICLSVYAVLFLSAVWIFAAPWVTYLAMAALTGAVYFGSTLVPGMTTGGQALLAAALGLGFWAARVILRRSGTAMAYHVPWLQGGVALAAAAMVFANHHLAFAGTGTWGGAGAFALVALLAVLLNREQPRPIWAHASFVNLLELSICGLGLATGGRPLSAHVYGLLFASDALALVVLGEGISSWLRRLEARTAADLPARAGNALWAATTVGAIRRFTLVATGVADLLGALDVGQSWLAGLVFVTGAVSLLWTTRAIWWQALVYVGLAHAAAGALILSAWSIGWSDQAYLVGWLAATAALIALALWVAADVARRAGLTEFYVGPCLWTALALTAIAFCGGFEARALGREAYWLGTLALAVNTIVTMLVAHSWRKAELTYLAVLHFVAASYLVLFSVGKNDPAMAYVLGLCAVVEAMLLWAVGMGCGQVRSDWARQCARPLFHSAVALNALAIALADRSALVFALLGVSFLLTVKSLPRTFWVYAALAAWTAGCYFPWLSHRPPIELMGVAVVAAFGLCAWRC